MNFMSNERKSIQQVPEIIGLEVVSLDALRAAMKMLLCSIPLTGILLIGGCNSHQQEERKASQESVSSQSTSKNVRANRILRRGLPGEPRTLDPQLADDEFSFQVLRDLFEGLTAEDAHGRTIPGVARSWSVSNDGTVYSFVLRRTAKWSDGSPVTASEFVNALRRAVDPRTGSSSAELLETVKGAPAIIAGKADVNSLGVSAVGQNIVRIELTRPAPFILQVLSQPIAAPLRFGGNGASLSSPHNFQPAISDGPFVLVKRVYGSYIDIVRNREYWDAAHISINRVRYVIAESEATELREYMAGQLDITYSIPLPDLRRMIAENPSEVQMAPILATFYLAANMTESRLRDDIDLRQALSMAVDRRLISEKIMLGVTPAYSFVPPRVRNYIPPEYPWAQWPRQQRLDFARKLFTHAGYSNIHPLHLRLYFNSDETIKRVMVAIAGSWAQNLGVITKLTSDEFRVFLNRRRDHSRWDFVRLGWTADYDDPASFLEVFAHDSPQNDASYKSAIFNDLINAARSESSNKSRINKLERAESVLLNDYAVIPIYFYEARRMVKPYVGGASITPLNRTYSKYLFWKDAP